MPKFKDSFTNLIAALLPIFVAGVFFSQVLDSNSEMRDKFQNVLGVSTTDLTENAETEGEKIGIISGILDSIFRLDNNNEAHFNKIKIRGRVDEPNLFTLEDDQSYIWLDQDMDKIYLSRFGVDKIEILTDEFFGKNLYFQKNLTVSKDFTVRRNAFIQGGMEITGNLTGATATLSNAYLTGDLEVDGEVNVIGDINTDSDITSENIYYRDNMSGATATLSNAYLTGELDVDGNINSDSDVTADNLDLRQDLYAAGDADIDGELNVVGDINSDSDMTADNLFLRANLSAAMGNLSALGVNGELSAASARITNNLSTGTLNVNGYFSAGSSSLGATTIKGDVSAANANVSQLGVVGNLSAASASVTGNFSSFNALVQTLATGYFSTPLANNTFNFMSGTIAAGFFSTPFSNKVYSFASGTLAVRDIIAFQVGSQTQKINQGYFVFNSVQDLTVSNNAIVSNQLTVNNLIANSNISSALGTFTTVSTNNLTIDGVRMSGGDYLYVNSHDGATFTGNAESYFSFIENVELTAPGGLVLSSVVASFDKDLAYFKGNLSTALGTFTTVSTNNLILDSGVRMSGGDYLYVNSHDGATFTGNAESYFSFIENVELTAPGGLVLSSVVASFDKDLAYFKGNLSAALGNFSQLGVVGNFSAGTANINGYFSAGSASLGATSINGVLNADTILGSSTLRLSAASSYVYIISGVNKPVYIQQPSGVQVASFDVSNIDLLANTAVKGYFSAGFSSLGTTRINGDLYANSNIYINEASKQTRLYSDSVFFNISSQTGVNFETQLDLNSYNFYDQSSQTGTLIAKLNGSRNYMQGAFGITGNFSSATANINGLFSAGNSTLGQTNIIGNLNGNSTSTIAARIFSNPGEADVPLVRGSGASYRIGLGPVVSDSRLKDNVQNTENSLSIIQQLRPVTFNIKSYENLNETNPERQIGLIAQEVEQIMPYAVKESALIGDTWYKGLDYGRLTPILIGGIQEQQTQIENLSDAIGNINLATLQSNYNDFKSALDSLSLSTGAGSLIINSGLTVTGTSLFNEASFTGNVNVGQVKIDSLENDISVDAASCVDMDGDLNEANCENNKLNVMKNKAGNVDMFDGKVKFKPNGEVLGEKVEAKTFKNTNTTAPSSSSSCNAGEFKFGEEGGKAYIYYCNSSSNWTRSELSTY